MRGGKGRWTSEKVRGALVHKRGRKYQVQSILNYTCRCGGQRRSPVLLDRCLGRQQGRTLVLDLLSKVSSWVTYTFLAIVVVAGHRHSGFWHLIPLLHSDAGLGPLSPVPPPRLVRLFFIPLLDWPDSGQSGIEINFSKLEINIKVILKVLSKKCI